MHEALTGLQVSGMGLISIADGIGWSANGIARHRNAVADGRDGDCMKRGWDVETGWRKIAFTKLCQEK